jgi:hypothetical protein
VLCCNEVSFQMPTVQTFLSMFRLFCPCTDISVRGHLSRKLVPLLDCYGLGQITRLVYVASAADGDVIGQQLKRNNFDQR